MRWRHLVTFFFVSAMFFLSARSVIANMVVEQPGPRLVTEPPPTLEDKARFAQIAAVLRLSATGKHVLNLQDRYNVGVRFEPGQGSSFNRDANRIRLESSLDPLQASLIFVHEMHHARTLHEGRKANPQKESRRDYVNHMLWEEAEGMAAGIQAKLELEDNGVAMAGFTLPLEHVYRQAYQGAVNRARLSQPEPNAQQLGSIGMAAGIQVLFDAQLQRKTRTAHTHEYTIDYYGHVWDEANPFKAFVGSLIS